MVFKCHEPCRDMSNVHALLCFKQVHKCHELNARDGNDLEGWIKG